MRTKNRSKLGSSHFEVTLVAAEITTGDNWDIEYYDGTRALDRVLTRNAPNRGLAQHAALQLAKQAESRGWRVFCADVRKYQWVDNQFEDPSVGLVLDAEPELVDQQYGDWDGNKMSWGEPSAAERCDSW